MCISFECFYTMYDIEALCAIYLYSAPSSLLTHVAPHPFLGKFSGHHCHRYIVTFTRIIFSYYIHTNKIKTNNNNNIYTPKNLSRADFSGPHPHRPLRVDVSGSIAGANGIVEGKNKTCITPLTHFLLPHA